MDSPRRSRRLAGLDAENSYVSSVSSAPDKQGMTLTKRRERRDRFCLNYLFVTISSFLLFTFFNVCSTKMYCA